MDNWSTLAAETFLPSPIVKTKNLTDNIVAEITYRHHQKTNTYRVERLCLTISGERFVSEAETWKGPNRNGDAFPVNPIWVAPNTANFGPMLGSTIGSSDPAINSGLPVTSSPGFGPSPVLISVDLAKDKEDATALAMFTITEGKAHSMMNQVIEDIKNLEAVSSITKNSSYSIGTMNSNDFSEEYSPKGWVASNNTKTSVPTSDQMRELLEKMKTIVTTTGTGSIKEYPDSFFKRENGWYSIEELMVHEKYSHRILGLILLKEEEEASNK